MPAKKGVIRYEPEAWAKAEVLYFQHYNTHQIARLTGITVSAIEQKVYGNKRTKPENTWKHRRNLKEKELIETVVDDNLYHMQKLFAVSLPLLTDAIAVRAKEHYGDPERGIKPKPLSMKEAKALTEIVTDLDHLFRLDTKQPTNLNASHVTVNIEDLRNALRQDKFLDLTADGRVGLPKGTDSNVAPRTAADVPTLADPMSRGAGDRTGPSVRDLESGPASHPSQSPKTDSSPKGQ